jgi:hypothetical protein
MADFHGLIKWVLDDPNEKVDSREKKKYLLLQPHLSDPKHLFRIEWREGGTEESNANCSAHLINFVKNTH